MKTRQISAWLAVGLVATSAVFTSCSKDDDTATLPPIGGYNSSDEVGASNLLAHWSFDGTTNELKSGTAPTTAKNNSFTTGVKGQALSLAAGYLVYPTIASLSAANALGSVTVSTWVNVQNNGTTASEFFAITQSTTAQTDWGSVVNLYAETAKAASYGDTLVLHGAIGTYPAGIRLGGDNINDYGVRGTDFQTVKGTGKWVHYVLRYDASASAVDIFANGIVVSNKNFRVRTVGSPAAPMGALVSPTPTQVLIGAFPNVTVGFPNSSAQVWQGLLTGSMDELRVYNKSLSDSDIGSLYQLELAGR
jgi:hypothetical protein